MPLYTDEGEKLFHAQFDVDAEQTLNIIHTIPTSEELTAALINWQVRTDELSEESFCKYINDKGADKAWPLAEYIVDHPETFGLEGDNE